MPNEPVTLLPERLSEDVAIHCTPIPVDCKMKPEVPAEPVPSLSVPLSWSEDVATRSPTIERPCNVVDARDADDVAESVPSTDV